ncbi:MAG TPA: hypothetical protein VFE14_20945 [Micromonosporaceae bacterium]|jgi:hypothetical protein|nr:hypothetical protein [Micromonosporaceae bacterium]
MSLTAGTPGRGTRPTGTPPAPGSSPPVPVGGQEPRAGGATRAPRPAAGGRQLRLPVSGGVDQGAAFILGLLAWAWVVLPFVTGGPGKVRDVLRAKLTNKAPDGSWLP